ncbi:MAG: hypothetical protein GY849_02600 [Deltaproteobacteria bacterium]|nr:hypothetical protein [Deltaproteobacteria bacterium]
MNLINLTPHPINVVDKQGENILSLPKCEVAPRLKQTSKVIGNINNIPITKTFFGEVENLPEKKEETFLIVSRLIMIACTDRDDLVVPNEIVRNKEGQIIACKSLANN